MHADADGEHDAAGVADAAGAVAIEVTTPAPIAAVTNRPFSDVCTVIPPNNWWK